MTDRELMQQALAVLQKHVDYYDYEQFTSMCELEPAKDLILALRERLKQPEQWEQLYPDIGNPFKRPATRDEKIVNPGVYEVQPETVMAEYKFQTYAAYKAPDGEMKIGVVPDDAPQRTHWEGCEEVHPECKKTRRREWVGLTEEERMDVLLALNWDKQLTHMDTAKSIEAKLKEKNA